MKINKELKLPIVLAGSTYLLSYILPKLLVSSDRFHYLSIPLDDKIPLFSPAIIIYILAFVQWGLCLLVLSKQDTKKGYMFTSAIIFGSIIGFIIFVVYPSAVHPVEVQGNSIFDYLLKIIYSSDRFSNVFPSFHCFCSLLSVKSLRQATNINRKTIIINDIFAILVYISTVLTKQHYIIDIPAGLLLADISLLIAKKHPLEKTFNYLNKKLIK